jgi:hypothetical protein
MAEVSHKAAHKVSVEKLGCLEEHYVIWMVILK